MPDNNRRPIHVSPEVHDVAKTTAALRGTTVKRLTEDALTAWCLKLSLQDHRDAQVRALAVRH